MDTQSSPVFHASCFFSFKPQPMRGWFSQGGVSHGAWVTSVRLSLEETSLWTILLFLSPFIPRPPPTSQVSSPYYYLHGMIWASHCFLENRAPTGSKKYKKHQLVTVTVRLDGFSPQLHSHAGTCTPICLRKPSAGNVHTTKEHARVRVHFKNKACTVLSS